MPELRTNPIFIIIKNFGALTVAQMLGRVLNFVIVAIIARAAGAEGLGGYATATAVSAFALILADMGLAPRLLREASANPEATSSEYAKSMGVKTLTSIFVCSLLIVLFLTLPYEPWVRDLSTLLSISWLIRSYTQINHSVIRAREKMELEALSEVVQTSILICGSLTSLLYFKFPIVSIGYVAIVAAIVQCIVTTRLASRLSPLGIVIRPDLKTIRSALPYSATLIAYAAFAQSNVIVLSIIAGQELVGEFTTVSRVLLLGTMVPQLITLAIMPASARAFGNADPARYRRLTTASLRLVVLLAGAGLVLVVSIAKPLLEIIYGEELAVFYPQLQLGSLYLVFQFGSATLGTTLTATGRQDLRARAIFIALVASICLFVGLTPWLGVTGAVTALVLSEMVLVAVEAISAREFLDLGDVAKNLGSVVFAATIGVGLHFWLFAADRTWLAMLLPALAYVLILLPFGEPQKIFDIVKHRR